MKHKQIKTELNTNLWCKLDRGFDSDGDISWPFVDFMNWDPVWIKAFKDSWKVNNDVKTKVNLGTQRTWQKGFKAYYMVVN